VKKREGFSKAERIRNRRDYLKVQQRGAKVTADVLLAVALPSEGRLTRVGLTVSTKVGNAVVRNRVRRTLRELCRKNKAALPAGVDVVLIAKPQAATADFEALRRAFEGVTSRLRDRFARPAPGAAP
jgi:ribonuclease P protein component